MPHPRFQFRLSTVFFLMTAIGTLCAVGPRLPAVFTAWIALALLLSFLINGTSY
jgi:hypothetical protein